MLARVTDQDTGFLRFLEQSHLTPGEVIRVESRNAAADRVLVRGAGDRTNVIGMRAAAKLLVAPPPSSG